MIRRRGMIRDFRNSARRSSAFGAYSLANNTTASYNTANGYSALYYNTEGDYNTATGFTALYKNQERKVAEQETTMTQLKATVAQQQKDFQVTTAEQKKDFESKIAHQQKQIEALTTGLQKVSDQLELRKPAQRTGVENR
jgi:uncharacterized coiled-coil protein SlyX